MQTIKQLCDTLGLDTVHQARNRVKEIEDMIDDHLKRGENNQLLITEEGVEILKTLQDLYESGLLLSEAANVLRSDLDLGDQQEKHTSSEPYGTVSDSTKRCQDQQTDLIKHLQEEIQFLRRLLGQNKSMTENKSSPSSSEEPLDKKWWTEWV